MGNSKIHREDNKETQMTTRRGIEQNNEGRRKNDPAIQCYECKLKALRGKLISHHYQYGRIIVPHLCKPLTQTLAYFEYSTL